MRIGIISDIHDHLHNLRPAIGYLCDTTDLLVCCGDLCSPFVMDELRKYPGPVHIIFGNNDADLFRITRKSDAHLQLHGEFLELNLDGFKIAANHFDNIAGPIARSGLYQLVCFGHNHRFSLERFGETVALNPGASDGNGIRAGRSRAGPGDVRDLRHETGQPALYRLSAGVIELSTWERPNS